MDVLFLGLEAKGFFSKKISQFLVIIYPDPDPELTYAGSGSGTAVKPIRSATSASASPLYLKFHYSMYKQPLLFSIPKFMVV